MQSFSDIGHLLKFDSEDTLTLIKYMIYFCSSYKFWLTQTNYKITVISNDSVLMNAVFSQ